MKINSLLGYLLYLLRRNDKSWNSLSLGDKEYVLEANLLHNNLRTTYANPEQYKSGQSFASPQNPLDTLEGHRLQAFLEEIRPEAIIEIGPGSGFYTRSIVNFASAKSYEAIDIVQAFLDFIKPHLETVKSQKPGFTYALHQGDFMQMDLPPCDAIFFISAVHHIPNRLELMQWVGKSLRPGGGCFIAEPAHYLPRLSHLLSKYFRRYYKPSHRANIEHFSTHHFCTLEEFEVLCKQVPGLKIHRYSFHRLEFPKLVRKVVNRLLGFLKTPHEEQWGHYTSQRSILRYFSNYMFIELQKTE